MTWKEDLGFLSPFIFLLPFNSLIEQEFKDDCTISRVIPSFFSLSFSIWWLNFTTIKIQNGCVERSCLPEICVHRKGSNLNPLWALLIWAACFICFIHIWFFFCIFFVYKFSINFLNISLKRLCALGRALFLENARI